MKVAHKVMNIFKKIFESSSEVIRWNILYHNYILGYVKSIFSTMHLFKLAVVKSTLHVRQIKYECFLCVNDIMISYS